MARAWVTRFGLVAALAVIAAPGAEAAGLFDELARAIFGGRPRIYATPIYEYDEPRVRPAKPRAPEGATKPKPPVVKLDPSTDPDWYLKDPTLRRGDIVVTQNGVLVYQGRDSDDSRPADFVALGGADSKGWKHRLNEAAAGGRNVFGSGSNKEAPAKSEPKRVESASR